MKLTFRHTQLAAYGGYIVQAIVNNFIPLLFITFQREYGIPLERITLLVTINFGVQLAVDILSSAFVDRIGYRAAIVAAHVFAAAGLIALPVLTSVTEPFAGMLVAVTLYAVGGGMIEVLISPIMEFCPTENKEKAMSLLHSFYCWGHVGVVLASTAFFALFGIENWRVLAFIWALVPICVGLVFTRTPIAPPVPEGERGMRIPELLRSGVFRVLFLMMLAAGASEQAVSQWASAFAEKGLGVTKVLGDLLGPMLFAVLMGASRAYFGKRGDKLELDRFMGASAILCIASYLIITLSPWPVLSLLGCGLCGLSVGIMWPGTFSKATASLKNGGTAMFALLALAGDIGCSGGPTLVGFVTGAAGGELKIGILSGVVFPMLMLLSLFLLGMITNRRT